MISFPRCESYSQETVVYTYICSILYPSWRHLYTANSRSVSQGRVLFIQGILLFLALLRPSRTFAHPAPSLILVKTETSNRNPPTRSLTGKTNRQARLAPGASIVRTISSSRGWKARLRDGASFTIVGRFGPRIFRRDIVPRSSNRLPSSFLQPPTLTLPQAARRLRLANSCVCLERSSTDIAAVPGQVALL